MEQLTFLWEERPASPSASPDFEAALMTNAETSALNFLGWLIVNGPPGLSGRTCPASCQATADGTLVPSSGRWANSGMGSPTGFLTLNTSEFHSDADACLLSDILETGDVPQRYFLSAKACQGILRRAEKRGKKLPPVLQNALQEVATNGHHGTKQTT